jgi:hypothetical protein
MTQATKKQTTTPKPKLTAEEVKYFSEHLSAVMTHENAPQSLKDGILEGISMLESEVDVYADNPHVIKEAITAYATDGFTVELEKEKPLVEPIIEELYEIAENAPKAAKRFILDYVFEKTGIAVDSDPDYYIEVSELAEAISLVAKHPDTPFRMRRSIQDDICEINSLIDMDAPESIQRALDAYHETNEEETENNRVAEAIKRDREVAAKLFGNDENDENSKATLQKQRILPDTQMVVINPQYDKLKRLVEDFFTLEVLEDYETIGEMAGKFICLFGELERLRKTGTAYYDSFVLMQEFCFTFTKDFENSFESYKAKINSQETDETNEPDENSQDESEAE